MSRPLYQHLAAIFLVAIMGAQLFYAHNLDSPTRDEPVHLTRGLAFWWEKDTRLSYAHPPLGNIITASVVALSEPKVVLSDSYAWERANVDRVYGKYEEKNFPASFYQIFYARKVTIILAMLLGLYLFYWTRSMFGWRVAGFATFLYSVHPVILANARLITTDLPVTLFAMVFLGEWIRYLKNGSKLALLCSFLACGAAIATKYTAAFLPVFAILSGLYCAFRGYGIFKEQQLREGIWRLVKLSAGLAAVCVLVINASYRFQGTMLSVEEILSRPEPVNYITRPYEGNMLEKLSPILHLPKWMPVPLPYTFIFGVTSIKAQLSHSHRSYFFGKILQGGTPLYFPVLILFKSPIVMTLTMALGLYFLWHKRRKLLALKLETQILLLFVAVFLCLIIRANLNIGVRHALMLFPPLIVLCAIVLIKIYDEWGAFVKIAVVLFCVEAVGHMAFTYPNHLGYFNLLVGGSANGSRISIVAEDWGQDIKDTIKYFNAKGIKKPFASEYGLTVRGEFKLNGLEATFIKCETEIDDGNWVSLHRNQEWRGENCYPWLKHAKQVALINDHVTVYYVGNSKEIGI